MVHSVFALKCNRGGIILIKRQYDLHKEMGNILIIGANGFTGRRIIDDLSIKYNVVGCSLRENIRPGDAFRFVQTDIRDAGAVQRLFAEIKPEVVINTSALSVPDYCENHHDEAYATNVSAVEQVAHTCEKYGSRFIHLSTDFVFEGNTNCLYTEDDRPNPVNYYGITKMESEQRVAACCSNYAIVRVAIVYGNYLPGQHGNILQLVANRLKSGEAIRVVSDQWRTPTFVGDVSDGVERLIRHQENGIFHICGSECLTISDVAYRVADYLRLDRSLIHPVTTGEMNEATPRPRFSGMSVEKAAIMLGYHPHTLDEGIREMFS